MRCRHECGMWLRLWRASVRQAKFDRAAPEGEALHVRQRGESLRLRLELEKREAFRVSRGIGRCVDALDAKRREDGRQFRLAQLQRQVPRVETAAVALGDAVDALRVDGRGDGLRVERMLHRGERLACLTLLRLDRGSRGSRSRRRLCDRERSRRRRARMRRGRWHGRGRHGRRGHRRRECAMLRPCRVSADGDACGRGDTM
mmetsp:Transcript_38811/g.85284  ORF Transcript_38811/g.85284 Transcript_38811/m.85284 type:complete len:202 (+) Transcript_38811:1516-2121(+)